VRSEDWIHDRHVRQHGRYNTLETSRTIETPGILKRHGMLEAFDEQ
jgi:hypothetical protein